MACKGLRANFLSTDTKVEAGQKTSKTTETLIGYTVCCAVVHFHISLNSIIQNPNITNNPIDIEIILFLFVISSLLNKSDLFKRIIKKISPNIIRPNNTARISFWRIIKINGTITKPDVTISKDQFVSHLNLSFFNPNNPAVSSNQICKNFGN